MKRLRDFYEILGVQRTADQVTIKKAYRSLAKKYHPDLNPGDEEAEHRFKEINYAYEVLSDEDKRMRYDRFGEAGVNQQGGFQDFGGFGDIFSDIFDVFGGFGGFSSTGGQRRGPMPKQGSDVTVQVKLSFQEALFGKSVDVKLKRRIHCHHCDGTAKEPGTEEETCPTCHGTGQERRVENSFLGQHVSVSVCSQCHGTGTIIKEPCHVCHGTGEEDEVETVSVKIPAGVDDGNILTLRGRGHAGTHGGPPGDAYLVVQVDTPEYVERQGVDLFVDVPLTLEEAVFGTKLSIPTIKGKETLKVHKGTQMGDTYVISQGGVPHLRRQSHGDLIVRYTITIPTGTFHMKSQDVSKWKVNQSVIQEREAMMQDLEELFTAPETEGESA